jgi:hypothetical protein
MLDVRGYVLAARRATQGAPVSVLLALIAAFGIISLCLLPLWIAFDLASTWEFTTSTREAAAPVVSDLATQAQGILGMSIASALAGFVLTSFTLLPSLFELAFPSVQHPVLMGILYFAIVFDYVTDFPKAWEVTGASAIAANPIGHLVAAAVFSLFVSVMVQALLVICLTVVITAIWNLVAGATARRSNATVINM